MNRIMENIVALVLVCAVNLLGVGCTPPFAAGNDAGALFVSRLVATPVVVPWWNRSYAHRRLLTVRATVATPEAYAVSFDFDHGALLASSKSGATGEDVRVVRQVPGAISVQLDRVVDTSSAWALGNSRIWFRTQASIAADSSDAQYFVYYGDASAVGADSAPANPSNVFSYFDEFNDSAVDNGWSGTVVVGAGSCSALSENLSILRISSSSTGALDSTADNICFARRTATGDFFADVVTSVQSPTAGTESQYGGVMLRVSGDANSVMAATAKGQSLSPMVYRSGTGQSTTTLTGGALVSHHRLVRIGDQVRLLVSNDGLTYNAPNGPIAFSGLPASLLVGPYLAFNLAATQSVDIERFRIRPAVFPEPTVTIGNEEDRPQ